MKIELKIRLFVIQTKASIEFIRFLTASKRNFVLVSSIKAKIILFQIFSENGTLSKELAFINVAGFAGMIIGAIYGGLAQSRISHFNYRESNEATLYYSNMAAHRSLHDEMTIGFGKGAFRWGRRIGIFCLSFA